MTKSVLMMWLCICLGAVSARAQQGSGADTSKKGVIRIYADTQLVHDIKAAVVTNDDPQMSGYRIQVYAGTDREEAQKMKNEIAMNHDVPTYMIYESPYFKVRVGDYRNKMEAQQMYHELKKTYTSILLVPGNINLPALKQ